ncbi:MAG: SDR family NAD(P)-dependent oxidoreductase [Bacteriovoracaceae bacterium]
MRFTDKVAIVTGAGSGIGKATAIKLASEGAKVVVAENVEDKGQTVVEAISSSGREAIFIQTDVSRENDLKILVDETIKKFKKIDVLVNNAAIMTFSPISEIDLEVWDRVIQTNLRSVFLLTKFCLPYMNRGSIVNVSSVHAHETTPNNSPYAASKGGIEAFTRAMSLELSPDHVRINNVAPGAVNTPMLWENPNVKSGKEKLIGRVAAPEEIACAIAFLASQDASFIHGTTLIVDAGRLAIL